MKFLVRTFISLCLVLALIGFGLYRYPLLAARLIPVLPSIERLPLSPESPKTVVKGKTQLLEPIKDKYVSTTDFPIFLTQATVAVEDERFYQHRGIDFWGLTRAMYTNLSKGDFIEGGSTITQQLARNLFLTQDQTAKRKLVEMFLALQLENYYKDKNKILELYLNNIYYGRNAYGIKAAAETYFSDVHNLSISEAAFLVGLPQSPTHYGENLNAAMARQRIVIAKMKELGYVQNSFENRPPVVNAWKSTAAEPVR